MKNFLRKILFLTILIVPLLFLKKELIPLHIGHEGLLAKYEEFFPRKKEFNTVIFGASQAYRHINTTLFDSLSEDLNISTYNFGEGGVFEAYFQYENFINRLDSGDIKYAIITLQYLHGSDFDELFTTKKSYWLNSGNLLYAYKYILNSNYSWMKKGKLAFDYSISFSYGLIDFSMLRNIYNQENVTTRNGYKTLESETGENFVKRWESFHSDTTQISEKIKAATTRKSDLTSTYFNKAHFNYLVHLIELSEKKGIHLIFLHPPRQSKEVNAEFLAIQDKLELVNSISIYEYPKYKDLYLTANTFDITHLTSHGANMLTTVLSEEFRNRIQTHTLSSGLKENHSKVYLDN